MDMKKHRLTWCGHVNTEKENILKRANDMEVKGRKPPEEQEKVGGNVQEKT